MVSLGGRAATELVLQIVDCGPRGDFEKAWSLARLYVTTYGMSKLGIISIDSQTPVSPSLRAEIEKEEQELIYRLKEKTYAIISANISLIKHIAEILVKQETILADEWNALVSQAKLLESLEEQAAPN
jgi:cell division protease FtsH